MGGPVVARWGSLATGTALLWVLCACGSSHVAASSAAGPDPVDSIGENVLFVMVQGDAEVAIVDMDALEVTGVIRMTDLGFGSRSMPHDVVVSPDGSHWFVSLIGENRVLRFDHEHQLIGTFAMETPGMLDLDPTGRLLVVSRSMSAVNPPARVALVRTDDLEPLEVDVLFPRPHGMVVDHAGRFAYTASLGVNQIASIHLDNERVELVDVPGPIHAFVQLAISPDGRTLVASGELSGQLVVFDLDDPARPKSLTSVEVGPQPFDPTFHPDGETVWVPMKGANEIVVVETAGWTVVDRVRGEGLLQPHALRFSPDGGRAFVTNNAADPHAAHRPPEAEGGEPASLVVVDVGTREVEAVLELGRNLTGIGARPVP